MDTGLHLTRIGQIAVNVHQLDRAVAFYRDTLGMKFLFQVAPKMAFFDCGGVRLMLAAPERPEDDHPSSIIYYRVSGLEAAVESLKRNGVAIEQGPQLVARMPDHELWMAFLRDPEGNTVALMDEVRSGPG